MVALGAWLCFGASMLIPSVAQAEVVSPTEIGGFISNPGMGWMTMFGPATSDPPIPDGASSTVYYYRINWADVHIGPDEYDFDPIDHAIDNALAGGQQIMLRLMPVWEESDSPAWMREAGFNGFTCSGHWVVDLDNPSVQEHISLFLQALADRYDGHVGVYAIEINFLGCWGEGNWACCSDEPPVPQNETLEWLADTHYASFSQVPIIGPIGGWGITGYAYSTYGDSRGVGIFFDCWGDYGLFADDWNHMEYGYPQWLDEIHGGGEWDSWEHGPLKLETCSTMASWPSDIPRALQWAIDHHASIIGNKNDTIPAGYDDEILEALLQIGYRLVLRRMEHADTVAANGVLAITFAFENIGNAPPYRDYLLALQLRGSETSTIVSDTSIRFWLPATHELNISFPLPDGLAQGEYAVALGVVSPVDNEPAINLAIEGRDDEGWYPLSTITVTPPTEDGGPEGDADADADGDGDGDGDGDSDSDGDTDGDGDADGDGDTDGDGDVDGDGVEEDDGCTCATASGNRGGGLLFAAVMFLWLSLREMSRH